MDKNSENGSKPVQLRREIGLFGGISIIAGMMIGSGIFYLGSYVLERTNMSQGTAILCWIIGGIVTILGGLCFAELGTARPVAGGATVYLSEAFHPVVGYMNGFSSWLLGGAGSVAALSVAWVTIFRSLFDISDIMIKVCAIVLIWVLTFVNIRGVKLGSMLQNFTMAGRLVPIILIIVLGLILGKESPDLSIRFASEAGASLNIGGAIRMIAFAVMATLWAYEGWTNLNIVTEEMKRPEKDLPRAFIISLVGVTVIYAAFNLALYRVLDYNTIVTSIQGGDVYLGVKAATKILGNAGKYIIIIGQIIAVLGTLNGGVLAFPRTYYRMAKDGLFFKSFAQLHPKYATPHIATLVQGVIATVLVLLRNLDQLTALVVFSGLLFNLLTIIAVPIYRKKFPDLPRPYKVWAYPVVLPITILLFFGLAINGLWEDPLTAVIGLIVPALGAGSYAFFKKRNNV